LAAGDAALLDLGVILGQNLAFSLVAGRCSAASASPERRGNSLEFPVKLGLLARKRNQCCGNDHSCRKNNRKSSASTDCRLHLRQ